jgi:hypothetical protein
MSSIGVVGEKVEEIAVLTRRAEVKIKLIVVNHIVDLVAQFLSVANGFYATMLAERLGCALELL